MKRLISIAAALFAFMHLAVGQTVTRTESFTSFSAIDVSSSFEVVLREGKRYEVEYTVDKRVADYCGIFLKGGVLCFNLDEKSFPKELKQQLKGKDKNVVLRATVTIPETSMLQNITVSDKAILRGEQQQFEVTNSCIVTASDNAKILGLNLESSQITLNARNRAEVKLSLEASSVTISAINNCDLDLDVVAPSLSVSSDNSSKLNCRMNSNSCDITAEASSELIFKGNCSKFSLKSKNNAKIYALDASVEHADLSMNSGTCELNVLNSMRLDLTSGAKLTFNGSPSIALDRIQNSTVLRYGDTKKKK